MIKLNLQFYAKKSAVDTANDKIDSYKQAYNEAAAKGDKAGMDAAHAGAEAVRASMASQGYTSGNYVSSGANATHTKMDTSNYSSDYDVSTNYYRPVEEEPVIEKPVVNGSSEYNALANQWADAQKQAQLAQIEKAYQNTLANISSQEDATNRQAKQQSNNASVQNQLASQRLNNYLAANGLMNSGTNAQARINNVGALQNNLGIIASNQQTAIDELGRQRALAGSNRESDIISAGANIDANLLNNQLNRLQNLEMANINFNNQKELAAIQQQYNMENMKYQTDVNNIYDETVGRYVPFSYYMVSHGMTSTGSSGGSSTKSTSSSSNNLGNFRNGDKLTDAQYISLRKSYNEYKDGLDGEKPMTWETWLYKNYGIYSNEDAQSIQNKLENGEWTSKDLETNKAYLVDLLGFNDYNELYLYTKAKETNGRYN